MRDFREGNIGPAIINVERSMTERGYMGLDVSSDDPEWVYRSPMSWNDDSTRATWVEKNRSTGAIRVQRAELKDAVPGGRVETVPTPAVGDYADDAILPQDGTFVIRGAHAGSARIVKEKSMFNMVSEVTVTYDNYSDDGEVFYSGTESAKGSLLTKTTYAADLRAVDRNGAEVGAMDVALLFSAAYGMHTLTRQITSPLLDLSNSHGTAEWMGSKADIATLVE